MSLLSLWTLLLLAIITAACGAHGAIVSSRAETLQEVEQRILNDEVVLRNDFAALEAMMGRQMPTARPPVRQYWPTPPVRQYWPTPPVRQYWPTPPVRQYWPTPPVRQYWPTPPVRQYWPAARPLARQYQPTSRPPVRQNGVTARPPVRQNLKQQMSGTRLLTRQISSTTARLNNTNVFVVYTCRNGVCIRSYTAAFYSTVSTGGLVLLLVVAAVFTAMGVARRRRAVAEFSVMSDGDSSPLLGGEGGGGGGISVGRGLSIQSDPVVLARV